MPSSRPGSLELSPPAVWFASVAVSFDKVSSPAPADGRILVLIAPKADPEPRFQVTAGVNAIQVFGIDVDSLEHG